MWHDNAYCSCRWQVDDQFELGRLYDGHVGWLFHSLRHTHASQLIDAGVDIVTISKRLGHAKPDITLRVYEHLIRKDDSKAAAAINAAMKA